MQISPDTPQFGQQVKEALKTSPKSTTTHPDRLRHFKNVVLESLGDTELADNITLSLNVKPVNSIGRLINPITFNIDGREVLESIDVDYDGLTSETYQRANKARFFKGLNPKETLTEFFTRVLDSVNNKAEIMEMPVSAQQPDDDML